MNCRWNLEEDPKWIGVIIPSWWIATVFNSSEAAGSAEGLFCTRFSEFIGGMERLSELCDHQCSRNAAEQGKVASQKLQRHTNLGPAPSGAWLCPWLIAPWSANKKKLTQPRRPALDMHQRHSAGSNSSNEMSDSACRSAKRRTWLSRDKDASNTRKTIAWSKVDAKGGRECSLVRKSWRETMGEEWVYVDS